MRYRQSYTSAPLSGDFVYVIQGRDAVKIGVTRNLEERLATLQTGSPHPLTLAYHMPIAGDAYAVEAEAHATLDRHRVSGEWFEVAPSMAVAAITEAAYRLGANATCDTAANPWHGWQRRLAFLVAYIAVMIAADILIAGWAAQFLGAAGFLALCFRLDKLRWYDRGMK